MITMTELAKLAGVSQPTVSRVLNGNSSVNPEVAKKVIACAEKYNYQPNMIARSLNGSCTHLIAVIVPDISNPFFADIIKHIEKEAERAGYSILIFNSDHNEEKERKCLELLQQYRADGLLLVPVHAKEENLKPFYQLTIPWIVITNKVAGVDSVFISHEKAGMNVAEHMAEVGVEKFIFIGKRHDSKFIGFEKGLTKAGVNTREDLTVFWEKSKEAMLKLLVEYIKELRGRAGIFALNDMEAFVIMNALMGAGISIPQKAVLVGFDNTFISKSVVPGITSINQPIDEMGRCAVKKLLARMKEKKKGKPVHLELSAKLIKRASSMDI